jgi:hypothetical protein
MRFIRVNNAWVNVDMIGRLVRHETEMLVYDLKGKLLGETELSFDISELMKTYVPATPGQYVLEVSFGDEDILVIGHPVVAWAIDDVDPLNGAQAVIADDVARNSSTTDIVYPLGGGKWCVPYEQIFDSYDDMLAHYRKQREEMNKHDS